MEDGEIYDTLNATELYDPSYEWPGEPSEIGSIVHKHVIREGIAKEQSLPPLPSLRLVVLQTSILPSKHKLALLDGYSELQFGRDLVPSGGSIPRIRLKEMAVSKLHATAYWDAQQRQWGIVDMGSKHGTFLKSQGSRTISETPEDVVLGVRLSPPRVASVPRRFRHLDNLTIGSTTFLVHIHEDSIPCAECSPKGGDEIPLFPIGRRKEIAQIMQDDGTFNKYSRDAAKVGDIYQQRDPKKALAKLKRVLLTQRDGSPALDQSRYIDRSARRRAHQVSSDSDAPGVPSRSDSPAVFQPVLYPSSTSLVEPRVPLELSQPPAPLPITNIGHRLLLKQGWIPGTSLGSPDNDSETGRLALVQPLEVSSSTHRAGLGMPSTDTAQTIVHANWKEHSKFKRWHTFRPDFES